MSEDYRKVLGTVEGLRRGFTTGTTAAAAAKAAAVCLLTGEPVNSISIRLPESSKSFSRKEIEIPVESCRILENISGNPGSAAASVIKDSGDDRDDTNGIEICAEVSFSADAGVSVDAGEGIGRVTGEGLPVKPGNPAINPVPEKMIKEELLQLLDRAAAGSLQDGIKGLSVVLSAPLGREIAAETWNSRIGVEGGISIIGTSGVVEPRSEKAFRTSLGMVIRNAALERESFTIISGYVGERFLSAVGADERGRIAVGDLIGFALTQCLRRGMKQLFLPLHIGKLTKIAAGLFNTHCDFGDARLETLAAAAAACGASSEQIRKLLDMQLAEEAASLLRGWALDKTFTFVAERAKRRCENFLEKAASGQRGKVSVAPKIETAALDLQGNLLGWSGGYETREELCRNFM